MGAVAHAGHAATLRRDLGVELATKYLNDGQANGNGTTLWHELQATPQDLSAEIIELPETSDGPAKAGPYV